MARKWKHFQKKQNGEITAEEYFEWKLNWREKRGAVL